jgi:hypothetical protein
MAEPVEYILILVGIMEFRGKRIAQIHITKDHFILFDDGKQELFRTTRMGSPAIVSGYIPDMSYGTVFRFRVQAQELYAISDEEGDLLVECTVTITE